MTEVTAVGIFWFEEEDWPRWREILEDAEALPWTYSLWVAAAEVRVYGLRWGSGVLVHRAKVSPDEFLEWCEVAGFPPNRVGRNEFADRWAIVHEKAREVSAGPFLDGEADTSLPPQRALE